MSLLQDRHVLILGLGLSGLAMARWCAAQGASVTVADTRDAPPQLEALRAQVPAARFVAGPMDAALVDDASLRAVYRSPGLAPAAISSVVNAARERGLPVSGELGLFAQALADLKAQRGYAPAVLAITGTNGKTTVTALTGQLVERAGLSVVVAGNIGPTLLETLQAHLADDSLPQAWVLELSSFQLDGSDDFEPTAATVLNVTQDHLDWHGDMAAYAAAKARIFGERAVMVLNRNDDAVMAMRPAAPAKLPKGAPRPVPRSVVSFGADMPAEPGDFGIEVVGGMAWLVRAQEADETLRRRKDVEVELHILRLMPADALRIRGRHNAVNALAALEGLGAERKLVVILGGDGKGQDFTPLAAPVSRFVRAVVLIGRDAPQVRAALADAGVPLLDATGMADAVAQARARAHPGDAVLLSPACASLDMFKDYAERAEVFRAAVRDLALAEGTEMEVLS